MFRLCELLYFIVMTMTCPLFAHFTTKVNKKEVAFHHNLEKLHLSQN